MKSAPLFSKEDIQLLRRPVLLLVVSFTLAAILFLGANYLISRANTRYQSAQSQYIQVQTSIQQIASEEATFVEYIDRYRLMLEDEIFEDEDRLRLLEFVQAIRQEAKLYPVEVEVEQQSTQVLSYPPEELVPGSEVALRFSNVGLTFDSLHEDDFSKLMAQFLRGPGLFVPISCLIRSAEPEPQFDTIFPYLNAECALIWFSINLSSAAVDDAL